MNNLKVSSRLNILLILAATAFSILLSIAYFGLGHLGELQDSGFKRSSESAEMQQSAKIGAVMYVVIADSIINHNLSKSEKDWSAIKSRGEKILVRVHELADTPDEKQGADKARKAYQELVNL